MDGKQRSWELGASEETQVKREGSREHGKTQKLPLWALLASKTHSLHHTHLWHIATSLLASINFSYLDFSFTVTFLSIFSPVLVFLEAVFSCVGQSPLGSSRVRVH